MIAIADIENEIAQEFLEGLSVGDRVRVRYGTASSQDTLEGMIEKWSQAFLSVKKESGGIARIRWDDLRSLEPLEDTPAEPQAEPRAEPQREPAVRETPAARPAGFSISRKMIPLPTAQPFRFSADTVISEIKTSVRQSESREFKNTIGGVLDSLQQAIRGRQIAYKYHDLRARVLASWDLCGEDTDYQIFYLTLGLLSLTAGDCEYALEPLVRARRYTLAAYAAEAGRMTGEAQMYSVCALLGGEKKELDQYLSEICVNRRDAEVLERLLKENREDAALCDQIASCAYMLFTDTGEKLTEDITPYTSAYDSARLLLAAVPASARCSDSIAADWETFQGYTYPRKNQTPAADPALHTGRILSFNPEQRYGFLREKSAGANYFFYISQVMDDSDRGLLLRKLLYRNQGLQLEVTYRIGESEVKAGQPAATAVQLSDAGYRAASEIARRQSEEGKDLNGFVENFYPDYKRGRVQSGGKRYHFTLENIRDPWLRAYYAESFDPQPQDVTFRIRDGKACDICWRNRPEALAETYDSCVTEKERADWEQFRERREVETFWGFSESENMDSEDPYRDKPYRPLVLWTPAASPAQDLPLTWGGKSYRQTASSPSAAQADTRKGEGTTRPAPAAAGGKKKFDPKAAMNYADIGRKAKIDGRNEEAMEAFENALSVGGFNESVVGDYVNLCMSQEGWIDRAVKLLDEYGPSFTTQEKLLNLKIQVYDKKRDYKALCPLYEKSFRMSKTISKKSHNLTRLIDAHIKLGEYETALETCKRWETFYAQNRYSADVQKLRNAISFIERSRAICYYHTGRVEEARKIATDLIRQNPGDTAANQILDGTLGTVSGAENPAGTREQAGTADTYGAEEFEDPDEFEESPETESESQFSRFVRDRIEQTDILASLKTPNVRNGQYIGSTEKGLEDVKTLATRRRMSSKDRSESLFAAASLRQQLEQRDDGKVKNTYYKVRLAGRAMASLGDYMVTQLNQLDTTRMCYLFALRVLTPNRRNEEQDWVDSYNRYIKSYFLAQSGAGSLEEYINQQANTRQRDAANTDVFEERSIHAILLPEFTVGILQLIEALSGSNRERRRNTLIEELYTRSPGLREGVCGQLRILLAEPVPDRPTREEFASCVERAGKVLGKKTAELAENLDVTANLLMAGRLSEERLLTLEAFAWKPFLTATDLGRLNQIHFILKRSQDYYSSDEFENRSDCLHSLTLEIDRLMQKILAEPTDVSYDIYRPALQKMALKVEQMQEKLYHDFLPRLSWNEMIQPFRTPDGSGKIQIQLIAANERNYQTADSLEITDIWGPDIVRFERPEPVPSLRGGEETEISLIVTISEEADKSGSFSASVAFSYQCSDAPQHNILKREETEFTFIIRNEDFQPLKNPFAGYEGNPMKDKAMFFGRSEMIREIVTALCPNDDGRLNYGRGITLYGQTRIGKSTLLYHLKKEIQERFPDEVVIWDMGNIGEMPKTNEVMANFLYTLLDIGNEAVYDDDALSEILEEEGLEAPLTEIREEPAFAASHFNKYMRALTKILTRENRIIVLFVDEFTYLHALIREGRLSDDFMKFWKALLQNNCIYAIIAGQDDMPEFMHEYQNEFACMELRELSFLDEMNAKLLIRKPIEDANRVTGLFRDDAIDEIYTLTAGSPYLTIILCSNLVRYLNEKGAYTVTRGIVRDFLRMRVLSPTGFLEEEHFESQMQERGHRELDAVNKDILIAIARLSGAAGYAVFDEIAAEVRWIRGGDLSDERLRELLERLYNRRVLLKEGGNKYWIQVRLLEKWLIVTYGG